MAGCCVVFALLSTATLARADGMRIGVGIYDITGPPQDVNLMGMANPSQKAIGVLQRLRARAFIFQDSHAGSKPVAFVSLDAGMSGWVLKKRVVAALNKTLPGVYDDTTVCISGTHTHSASSGFLQHTIFQFAGTGWVPQSIDAFVNGTVAAVLAAHASLAPATLSVSAASVHNASINRSPTAYLLNPAAERAAYPTGDLDLEMVQLAVRDAAGTPRGLLNWHAVHGTSLNNTNQLLSGDNKGHASYLLERIHNGPTSDTTRPGHGPFVAAFAATALGDVSPNTRGALCRSGPMQGQRCDTIHSTCLDDHGTPRVELCTASGPGDDMYASSAIIAASQARVSSALFDDARTATPVTGRVRSVLTYADFGSGLAVHAPNGTVLGTTCAAAYGESFAAGTTDGPGQFDFNQAGSSPNPLVKFFVAFLRHASPEDTACHAPKSILLPSGRINVPWPWSPSIVSIQLIQIGHLFVVALPTELTTMAGRRIRKALGARLQELTSSLHLTDLWVAGKSRVVLAGLANGYADYTVTFEEYQQQRYEGGSTVYGPHQLNAYIEQLLALCDHLAKGTTPPPTTPPQDFSASIPNNILESLVTAKPLKPEAAPPGQAFGDVLTDAPAAVTAGQTLNVTFLGGNLRTDLRTHDTYVRVERRDETATPARWLLVAEDSDPETRISAHPVAAHVELTARWDVPADATPGSYRITLQASYMRDTAACGVCGCESPRTWPLSGCDIGCGAKCGDTCCCVPGVGECGTATPEPTPYQGSSRVFTVGTAPRRAA